VAECIYRSKNRGFWYINGQFWHRHVASQITSSHRIVRVSFEYRRTSHRTGCSDSRSGWFKKDGLEEVGGGGSRVRGSRVQKRWVGGSRVGSRVQKRWVGGSRGDQDGSKKMGWRK